MQSTTYELTYRLKESEATVALEAIVDKHGMSWLIGALATVASEKAEHIRTNWSTDRELAARWDDIADLLTDTAGEHSINIVS